jgi:diadenosine tetraphosphatase ApaH/serine/threonine PP2A family protein phosphatase
MLIALGDGYRMFVQEVGEGFPLIVLHGGPGLDHTHFRPYLDPLGDEFQLAVPAGFAAETIHPPEVLRHFAVAGYGDYDYRATLARVSQPTLVRRRARPHDHDARCPRAPTTGSPAASSPSSPMRAT